MECYGEKGQDNLAAQLATLAKDLDPGQMAQILVQSRPLDGTAVLADFAARLQLAGADLTELGTLQQGWLAQRLEYGHVSDLSHHVVVSTPAQVNRARIQLDLGRGRTERRALEQATSKIVAQIERMDLDVEILQGQAVLELLWASLHPDGAPCPRLDDLHAEGRAEALRLEREAEERRHRRAVRARAARRRIVETLGHAPAPVRGIGTRLLPLQSRLSARPRAGMASLARLRGPDETITSHEPATWRWIETMRTRLRPTLRQARDRLPLGADPEEVMSDHLMRRLCDVTGQETQLTWSIDGHVSRTIFALQMPEETSPGCLDAIVSLDCPYRLSIHIEGMNLASERKRLNRRRKTMYVIAGDKSGRGPSDLLLQQAQEETAQQIIDLRGNKSGIARVGLYLTLTASDAETLEDYLERAAQAIAGIGLEPGTGLAAQLPLWQSTLPLGCDRAGLRKRARTETIGNLFPFTSHTPGHPRGLPLGFTKQGQELVPFDPFHPSLPNQVMNIVGMSGRGKTFLALRFALYMLMAGGRVTVIDRAGSYRWLMELVGGSSAELGSKVNPPAINMWDYDGEAPTPSKVVWLSAAHEIMLATNPGDHLDAVKLSMLSDGIRTVYAAHLKKRSAGERGPRDFPRERELVDWLEQEMRGSRRAADEKARLRELKAGLEPFVGDGEYANLVDRPTNVDFEARMLVIDMQQLGAAVSRIHALALHMITEVVERRATARERAEGAAKGLREMLIIDEGWFLIRYGAGGAFINNLARQGRALGLWLVFITQQLSDLVNDPTAAALFNAASVTFLYQQSDEGAGQEGGTAWLARTLGLSSDEVDQLSRLSQGNDQSYAEMFMLRRSSFSGTARRGVVQVMASKYEYWLFTSKPDPDKPRRLAMVKAHDGDVWEAVKALAEGQLPPDNALYDAELLPTVDTTHPLGPTGPVDKTGSRLEVIK